MSTNTNTEITAAEIQAQDAASDIAVAEGQEKFSYIQDKDPSPKHEFYAAMISALTGIQVTPKQYQAMILTHRYIQASDLNKAREDYRPRTNGAVLKGWETLADRVQGLPEDDSVGQSENHIPEEVAEMVTAQLRELNARRAEEMIVREAEVEEAETGDIIGDEAPVEEEENGVEYTEEVQMKDPTKRELINMVLDFGDGEYSKSQLNKMTKAEVEELASALV